METTVIIVRGTLKPDGTLELAERPALPAGPVEITIRAVLPPDAPAPGWWDFLQAARARREAEGQSSRTTQEIDSEIDDLRDFVAVLPD